MRKVNRRLALVSAIAISLTMLVAAPAKAALPTVRIEVGGLSKQIYIHAMLTQQLGYYKKYGINVVLTDEAAGASAEDDMLTGSVDFVLGFYDHNIDLRIKGKNTVNVATLLQSPGEVELCRSDLKGTINSPADWAKQKGGVSLGVTGLGSSTNFLTLSLGAKAGVPQSAMHSFVAGAGTTFIAAMKNKAIDCGMTTEPTISQVLDSGLGYVLVDMRYGSLTKAALGGPYPATCVYGREDWIAAHSDLTQRVVDAMMDTTKFIESHTADQIAAQVPADYYAGTGLASYVKALNNELVMYNPTGKMPSLGPRSVLTIDGRGKLASGAWTAAQMKAVDLHATYTDQYVTTSVRDIAKAAKFPNYFSTGAGAIKG
ncbi:MAG: ABC transporter substrate-binding protein [Actinomycetes bacterium]